MPGRNIIVLLALLIAPALSEAQSVGFGKQTLFNSGWQFALHDDASYKDRRCDTGRMKDVSLPHDWSVEGTPSKDLSSCTGYLPGGVGWYRKVFKTSELGKAETYGICFEGIYNRSEVYLNGHLLGMRPNGYVSMLYDMTPYLNKKGENVLAVRVDHSRSADSRYYTGSGIYRDVWLVTAPKTRLAQWGLTYELRSFSGNDAEMTVISGITRISEKGYALRAELRDAAGKVVATTEERSLDVGCDTVQRFSMHVKDAKRWSLDAPYLYTLTSVLTRNGKETCRGSVRAGLREIRFDADKGFFLNGRNMKMKGVCLHHDFGVLGAAVPRDVWKRRLQNLKDLGVNAVRTSHNLESPAFYDLCDELGLLVMDEAFDEWEYPKRKWLEGWNVGTPGYQGTYDYFNDWSSRDIADMVLRDRAHPSVVMWSVGNEVDYPNDPYSHPVLNGNDIQQPMYGGYDPGRPNAERIGKIGKRLAEVIRGIDRSRPVTGALAGVVMSNETDYPAALDIVGYNYTENRYDMDHGKYPERVIYGSENGQGFGAWKDCRDREFIFGQFLWTGADYLGESLAWPSRGMGTGLLDFCSLPKPRGRFREALWSDKPVTYIGTYPISDDRKHESPSIDAVDDWNYQDGQTIRVCCYTNAVAARLLLDGTVVGERKPYNDNTGIIFWDIPYRQGELRAEGLDNEGRVVSHYVIPVLGDVVDIRTTPDKAVLRHKGDVAHVLIEAFDTNGNVVTSCSKDVSVAVGKGLRLLGVESGNNGDMISPKSTHRNMHRGRLLAYVQSTADNVAVEVNVPPY